MQEKFSLANMLLCNFNKGIGCASHKLING